MFPGPDPERNTKLVKVRTAMKCYAKAAGAVLALLGGGLAGPLARADSPPIPPLTIAGAANLSAAVTYADLADLADGAPLVIKAQLRKLTALDAAQVRQVRPGWGRFYVEARTEALIAGAVPIGEALRYLVDLPLDAKGKPPKLKKRSVLLFARSVAGRPGELQLVAPDAQLVWDVALDQRLRGLLAELLESGAPQKVTGVREAIYVPGNLAGEGETQVFLTTANDEPAAITANRRPGQPLRWSVSFSEVVGGAGAAPQRETLAWYRLACFLPQTLPAGANISETAASRIIAAADYRAVVSQLGSCPRSRK
jgi:hypothetical protein